jgi:lipooligosaccharide transport system ATP-binding protein
VAEGSPRELIQRHATREVVELRYHTPELQHHAVGGLKGAATDDEHVEPLADRVLVYTHNGDDTVTRLGVHHGGAHDEDGSRPGDGAGDTPPLSEVQPDSVLVRRSSLEDVFLMITGRTLED